MCFFPARVSFMLFVKRTKAKPKGQNITLDRGVKNRFIFKANKTQVILLFVIGYNFYRILIGLLLYVRTNGKLLDCLSAKI